jgi:tRNA (guanine37-N1)-methyltransferase
MRIDVVTIFPGYLDPLRQSLLGKAIDSGLVELAVHDLRRWTHDVHRSVDDTPYGGGPGMVMKAPVWGEALDEICSEQTLLVVPSPAGRLFTQAVAGRWCSEKHLVFACGRYEGIDQRVVDDAARRMRVEEVSIGDYVLPGGESAAVVMIEAVLRLVPEVLGNPQSHLDDSLSRGRDGLLEGPATLGRRTGEASTCPTCCAPATMRGSPPGGTRLRCNEPGNADRTCWTKALQIRPLGNMVSTAWVIVARAVSSLVGCSDSITTT